MEEEKGGATLGEPEGGSNGRGGQVPRPKDQAQGSQACQGARCWEENLIDIFSHRNVTHLKNAPELAWLSKCPDPSVGWLAVRSSGCQ